MRFDPSYNSSVVSGIENSEEALQTAYQQVTTGLRVNAPSDDPAASAAYIQLQAQSANIDQYTSNAESALSQAQTADGVLTSVVSLLNQAITYGTEGANGTSSTTDRKTIAADVKGVLSTVIGLANTTFQGISLFGGTVSGQTPAFSANANSPTGNIYNGNSTVNSISVGDTLTVQANVPGSTVFDAPGASAITALSDLEKALTSGTSADIGKATVEITTALNHVTEQHTIYGNTINQLTSQETYLSQEKVTLTSSATSLVGIDPATAAENLSQAEVSNSSVLAAAAKVIQNSLLSYLK